MNIPLKSGQIRTHHNTIYMVVEYFHDNELDEATATYKAMLFTNDDTDEPDGPWVNGWFTPCADHPVLYDACHIFDELEKIFLGVRE